MNTNDAKKIMGRNVIGPEELSGIADVINITLPKEIPDIPFLEELLRNAAKDYLLILGVSQTHTGKPLTLTAMREHFGWDPVQQEPCFYNQDWYLNEPFARDTSLEQTWYLIKKTVNENSQGKHPSDIQLQNHESLPSAVLTAFSFFANYFLHGEMLWKHDFVWCADKDTNGDQIYTGRYVDPKGINKNGFNIHRYLSLRPAWGVAPQLI